MAVLADEPVIPTEKDKKLAVEVLSKIGNLKGKASRKFTLASERGDKIALSEGAFRLLMKILEEMAKGNGLVVLPIDAELTTQQAADFLNVSRPFFVKLLEERQIPCRKVGRHRRVRLEDLLAYKRRSEQERLAVLDELSALDQELNLGFQ